ncbi:MAG: FhaA domain-containing protein [Phototrophicaceae bacterium]
MNEKHIAQLEAQLELLVEGTFTNLFRKRITAHDIAMKLARSLENTLRYAHDSDDMRPIAPDAYTIQLHPQIHQKLSQNSPQLLTSLSQHIVDLVAQSGYRLNVQPVVQLVADDKLAVAEVEVEALHTTEGQNTTQSMQPILAPKQQAPKNPQLIINEGERIIELKGSLLNVGRADDNHIILDDPFCSRHHLQLRLRFGSYTLFDVDSRAGTTVNNIPVAEHQLQSGDVIKIGHTQLVYLTHSDKSNTNSTTQSLDPVIF